MGVERVRDADDPRLADYRELRDGERRRRAGTFVAESRQVVRRLLGSRFRARSVLATEAAAADLRDVLADGLPVYVAPEETLERVVGFNFHSGCLAVGERGAELPLMRCSTRASSSCSRGSRTPTTWAGCLPERHGVRCRRRAPGARLLRPPLPQGDPRLDGRTLVVPFARAAPWPGALARLREHGFTIVALTPDGDVDVADLGTSRPVPERVALLLGAEGEGVSPAARAAADVAVAIRMAGRGHSLNVVTVSGIALHRVAR